MVEVGFIDGVPCSRDLRYMHGVGSDKIKLIVQYNNPNFAPNTGEVRFYRGRGAFIGGMTKYDQPAGATFEIAIMHHGHRECIHYPSHGQPESKPGGLAALREACLDMLSVAATLAARHTELAALELFLEEYLAAIEAALQLPHAPPFPRLPQSFPTDAQGPHSIFDRLEAVPLASPRFAQGS